MDGASRGNPGNAGSGGLFRDHRGMLIIGYATFIGVATSVYAEANAILFGLKLAQELQLFNIWLESDSELVVKMLNGMIDPPWGIHYILMRLSL